MTRHGYTLIEMLIVVIVVGVTAAVAVPSVSRGVGQDRVNRAASIVAGDLEQAFASAARQRKPIRVTFTTQSYTINDRASGSVLVTRDFGPSSALRLTSLSASAATLDIYPSGIASGPDTVTLRLGSHSRRVTVSRVGIIRGIQ